PADADELRRMEYLLEKSLDEGGWGLTTGLVYQPGRYSTPEEVLALAKAAAARGGFYATPLRSEGDRILEAIDEVIGLVEASGIRAEISHLKTSDRRNWGKIDAVLDKMDRAVASGLLLGSDRYPYCAAGTDLDIVLPDWAQTGAAKGEMERLADPVQRSRIIAEIDADGRDWSTVMIGGTWSEKTRGFSGRRVSEFAGGSPGEAICSILELDECRTGAFFFGMSEENLGKIYRREWVLPGSDASLRSPTGPLGADHPHPRAYATMPEFYRRVRELGFTREETIARMTSAPAKRFGIRSRGVLEKGAFADIAIWEEDAFRADATYLAPHRFSSGMKRVFVNGETGRGRFLER
ncbi:MAG: amidohydrolase family protein, partial [Kiritimatiellae bacterium]|nr:amidohydrolase family protein [Kiritimatiellia bacterium]